MRGPHAGAAYSAHARLSLSRRGRSKQRSDSVSTSVPLTVLVGFFLPLG
jgi:hypothetical protein